MKSRATILARLFLFGVGLVATIGSAVGAVPGTMNYQGQLTNSNGSPVNTTVPMEFRLYDVASGGSALWVESQSVAVSNGYFNVELGSVTPFSTGLFDVPLFLGVTVGTDGEMSPRRALSSSGYAFKARETSSLKIDANQILIYSTHANCSSPGKPTFETTCFSAASGCGTYTSCGVFSCSTYNYHRACDGSCPGLTTPQTCDNPIGATLTK